MDSLTVPEILNIPEKLVPIILRFNEFRYFLLEGGRGGSKSQSVGRFILFLAEKKNIRIVCGRETQNSINESVYSLLVDLINRYSLNFDVGAQKITHRVSGTAINFRGFREQGAFNIQGMEGIDIVWIDEAQAITNQTLDVLIPTIRKDNAKIFFTMNRHVYNDPVYDTFAKRDDCLHIHIDYIDNPFCTEALKKEAEECKARDEQDYRHIWLGYPLEKGDDCLLDFDIVNRATLAEVLSGSLSLRRRVLGVDVARFGDDETVYNIIETYGARKWNHIFIDAKRRNDTMQTVGTIIALQQDWDIDITVVDEGGVGGGVIDRLVEQRRSVIPFDGAVRPKDMTRYANVRAEGYFMLKDLITAERIRILNDPMLIEQLLSIRYKFKSTGQRMIVSKDEMRKDGIKSPDRADSLMMAVSQIETAIDRSNDRGIRLPEYAITNDATLVDNLPQYA